jgi:hypothetical protein
VHFETYDFITGKPISQTVTLDFGDIIQGQHCSKPVVVRAMTDTETVTNAIMYLQNKGLWKNSAFGYYLNSTFLPSIEAGSAALDSSHFIEVLDPVHATPGVGVPVPFSGNASEFIWFDIQVFQTGTTEATYQMVYNYT